MRFPRMAAWSCLCPERDLCAQIIGGRLAHMPPELVTAHLHIDKATLDAIPKEAPLITSM